MNPDKTPPLDRLVTPRRIGAALGVVAALDVYILAVSAPRLRALAGGRELPELRGAYPVEKARAFFAALGDEGRWLYGWGHLAPDTALALVEGAALCAIVACFTRVGARFALRVSARTRAALLAGPLLYAAADVTENALLAAGIVAWPETPAALLAAASAATSAKWALSVVALGGVTAVVAAAVALGAKKPR
ncbi:MAG: hypothetical protein NW215_15415 [Hyphomicrobiales bacterium]|nr:hypothetical protein [Hyphomicrobiales bacterium]